MVNGVYEGSGGNICYEFLGGADGNYGNGWNALVTGTDDAATGANSIGGVTHFNTGTTADASSGIGTAQFWQGRSTQNGLKREAMGTLVAKLRVGFTAQGDGRFFFGMIDVESAGIDVEDILTVSAAGVVTDVLSDYAGWYWNSDLSTDADQYRTVTNQLADTDLAAAKPGYEVDDNATISSVSPARMPTLGVEVNFEGTVDFYYNGVLTSRVEDAINPEQQYSCIAVIDTDNTTANVMSIQRASAEAQTFYGPIFA